jgi:carbonic anhydrase
MRMSTNRGRPTLLLALVLASLASCASSSRHGDGHVHWGYEADDGPARWGAMDPDWILCAEGLEQSPIDLTRAVSTTLPALEFELPSGAQVEVLNQRGVVSALDNGHTIQVNAPGSETLTIGGKEYELVQFHFHAPSEHTVNGRHYPMEAHFVHQAADGELAVVGLFIEEGARNPGFAPIWAELGNEPGDEEMVIMLPDLPRHFLAGRSTGVHHYEGSLTTPPCSEGVQWYIRSTPTQLSRAQIEAFTALYDHNNRPVQPLNDRTLYLDERPTIELE